MSSKYDILLESAISFLKLAGILKVPGTLLNEMKTWCRAAYCYYLLEPIRKYREASKERSRKYEQWAKRIDLRETKDFASVIEYGKFLNIKEFLVEECKKNRSFGVSIPYFDPEKEDTGTGFIGVIGESYDAGSFNFSIFIHDMVPELLGKVRYSLSLVNPETGKRIKYSSDSKHGLDEVVQKLIEHSEEIAQIFDSFFRFMDSYELESKEYLTHIGSVEGICNRYMVGFSYEDPGGSSGLDGIGKTFNVPLYETKALEGLAYPAFRVSCQIMFDHGDERRPKTTEGEDYLGLWRHYSEFLPRTGLGSIKIVIKKPGRNEISSPWKLEEMFQKLDETVRHELQHLMQTYIRHFKGLKEEGGLPGKKIRQPGYDVHGGPIGEGERQAHELRDIEFYNDLSDVIEQFKSIQNRFPAKLHSELIAAVVGNGDLEKFKLHVLEELAASRSREMLLYRGSQFDSIYYSEIDVINQIIEFFNSLQKHQPLKYRKAVLEFYKAVS